jgi:hypothetical protein
MAEAWTDERLDAVLLSLGAELEVPAFPARRASRRWVLVAAAVVLVVVAGVLVIAPARDTVARWFGLEVRRDEVPTTLPSSTFDEGVAPLDVDVAIGRTGLDPAVLAATSLGPPDAAGAPPEGGTLLAWDRGDTTLWVRVGEGGADVVKRLQREGTADFQDVGDVSVLIEGAHVLETPSRTVAAGRVLWWVADGQEHRLESDLPAADLLAIARQLD